MTAPDNEVPSTSWAVWAWQAYREGRLVQARATPAPAAMTPEVAKLVEAVERLLPVARHYGGLTDDHVAAIENAEATVRNFRKVSTVKHSLTTAAALRAGGDAHGGKDG